MFARFWRESSFVEGALTEQDNQLVNELIFQIGTLDIPLCEYGGPKHIQIQLIHAFIKNIISCKTILSLV